MLEKSRTTFVIVVAILIAHTGLLVYNSLRNSATYDEGPHLAAGLAYLRHGEMSIYNLSPPLLRMWAALPALVAGADVPPAKPYRDLSAHERYFTYYQE